MLCFFFLAIKEILLVRSGSKAGSRQRRSRKPLECIGTDQGKSEIGVDRKQIDKLDGS